MNNIDFEKKNKHNNKCAKLKYFDKIAIFSLANICIAGIAGIVGLSLIWNQNFYKSEADNLLCKYGYTDQSQRETTITKESKQTEFMKENATKNDFMRYSEYKELENQNKSVGTATICGAGVIGLGSLIVATNATRKKSKDSQSEIDHEKQF